MVKKNIDPDGDGDQADSPTTGPDQHTQPNAFPNDKGDAEESKKYRLPSSQDARRWYAPPRPNYAAHKRIDSKAPSRKPDRHEEPDRHERAPSQHQDRPNRKQ